jgi:hypothetical protein
VGEIEVHNGNDDIVEVDEVEDDGEVVVDGGEV